VPYRTARRRSTAGNFPSFLVANAIDLSQVGGPGSEAEDPLLDLLRNGQTLDEEAFLTELRRQRTPATAAQ